MYVWALEVCTCVISKENVGQIQALSLVLYTLSISQSVHPSIHPSFCLFIFVAKAQFKRQTFHVPNSMQIGN